MDQQLIINLFQKYLHSECSAVELGQLVEEFELEENRQVFLDLIRQQFENGKVLDAGLPGMVPPQLEKRWASILTEINRYPAPEVKRVTFFWRRLVAAVAIGLLGFVGYWMLKGKHDSELNRTTDTKPRKDLPPGGNKAVLTLGNGTNIVLDSAHNGMLTKQGNTTIIKSNSGQLEYRPDVQHAETIVYNTLSTPKGGQYQLDLPDGSKVWLNAASSIKYPTAFIGVERRVEITGEAYFEVAKNAAQPFVVDVNGEKVTVLGTSFNVNAYGDEPEIRTTLVDGSVKVSKESIVGVNTNNDKLSAVLRPGQQAQLAVDVNTNSGDGLKIKNDADVEGALAWKNGQFIFNRLDMASILRQISRWYDVEVVGMDVSAHRTFSGIVSRDSNLSEVMKILESAGIHFRIEGKKMILLQ